MVCLKCFFFLVTFLVNFNQSIRFDWKWNANVQKDVNFWQTRWFDRCAFALSQALDYCFWLNVFVLNSLVAYHFCVRHQIDIPWADLIAWNALKWCYRLIRCDAVFCRQFFSSIQMFYRKRKSPNVFIRFVDFDRTFTSKIRIYLFTFDFI